ncbi:hypothetical protein Mapa_018916 [Marchantia paleacea]|nr:hypothetical protein Mapa_018916 [Marchantia paleacea]
MKTILKVLPTFEKQTNKNFWNKPYIYIFFFQENFYGIAYNRFINKTNYKNIFFWFKK